MAEHQAQEEKKHRLCVQTRACAEVSGVTDVESFDEQTVVLTTDCGEMTVEGEGLHVSTLDIARGVVEIHGRIHAVVYGDAMPQKRGLRQRLFG